MRIEDIEPGTRVRIETLHGTSGMLIVPKYLSARREGAVGTVKSFVPGHGGDVWWVEHEDKPGEFAAYMFDEFALYDGPVVPPKEPDEGEGTSIFD